MRHPSTSPYTMTTFSQLLSLTFTLVCVLELHDDTAFLRLAGWPLLDGIGGVIRTSTACHLDSHVFMTRHAIWTRNWSMACITPGSSTLKQKERTGWYVNGRCPISGPEKGAGAARIPERQERGICKGWRPEAYVAQALVMVEAQEYACWRDKGERP